MKELIEKCSKQVFDGWRFHPCHNNAKIKREGKWYCNMHDPVMIKKRRDKQDAKYHKEAIDRQVNWTQGR